jgi:hypothetical protein
MVFSGDASTVGMAFYLDAEDLTDLSGGSRLCVDNFRELHASYSAAIFDSW